MFSIYVEAALLIWAYMTLVFLFSLLLRDNSVADVAWGMGFVVVAWWVHLRQPYSWSVLPTTLISIWGLRLALHIGVRNRRRGGEDWRYANWRRKWGRWVIPRSYLQVFLLQGFLMWVIAAPLLQRPAAEGLNWYQWLGVVVWSVGFVWEAVADWQLLRFKTDAANRGKILTGGLWRFSRHPNYFGEIVLWWGLWLSLLPNGHWWISLAGPLVLTWLLTRVSGVPMLEEKYKDNPAYRAYMKATPALWPKITANKR